MDNQVALWIVVVAVICFAAVLAVAPVTKGGEPTRLTPLRDDQFVPVPDYSAALTARVVAVAITDAFLPPTTQKPYRPTIRLPSVKAIVVAFRPARLSPARVVGKNHSRVVVGTASWYCEAGHSICVTSHPDTSAFDAYAAAGPALRVAMGGGISVGAPQPWRNKIVYVNGLRVKLIDWCQCYLHRSNEKVIDLYHDVWVRLGAPRRVTIRW